MKQVLHDSMPLFLKLIYEEKLTDMELNALELIRQTHFENLDDDDFQANEDPLYLIYLSYCRDLVEDIVDSENAKATYTFISALSDTCKLDELKFQFESLSEQAYSLVSFYEMNELYDLLVAYNEEERHLEIENLRQLSATLIEENPDNIHLIAQNNLLSLLLIKWECIPTHEQQLFCVTHIQKIFSINQLFKALNEYHSLSELLRSELAELWDKWFIKEYLIVFFIPSLNSIYNINTETEAAALLELEDNDDIEFDEIIQNLLFKCIDTCILKHVRLATASQGKGQKTLKNSKGFCVRNIGNINLMELNIPILLLMISKNTKPQLAIIERLNSSILEFIPYASSQWLIDYHRIIIDFTERLVTKSEPQKKIFGMYIEMSQLFEHCYYNKTGGKSIPAPAPKAWNHLGCNIVSPKRKLSFI